MLRILKAIKFFITDTWASRKESVDMPERREYYRNASDMRGRGLGGAGASTIKKHTEGTLKPPTD